MIASTEIGSNSSGGPRVVMKPLSEVTFSASISMQFGETDIANEEETLSSCDAKSLEKVNPFQELLQLERYLPHLQH